MLFGQWMFESQCRRQYLPNVKTIIMELKLKGCNLTEEPVLSATVFAQGRVMNCSVTRDCLRVRVIGYYTEGESRQDTEK